jgi:HK97 family phage portal protein
VRAEKCGVRWIDTTMLNWIKNTFLNRSKEKFAPLSKLPDGFFASNAEMTHGGALSLSPFYSALRLFQTTVGSLPLVTYTDSDDGRERAKTHPAYHLLHAKPNPAMSRATFWEHCVRDLFMRGEFFIQVIWSDNGKPKMLLPVPWASVKDVKRRADWTKEYQIQTANGLEIVPHEDMIHVLNFPDDDSHRGLSLLKFAQQSLNLHREVQTAGTEFFKNAVRPSGQLTFPGKVDDEAAERMVGKINDTHAGSRGKTLWLASGGKWEKLNDTTADDAKIIEALSSSVADIARWYGVSPLTLGDLSRGTYSNLAADNAAFYQRSARPILDKIELAVNDTLFGVRSDTYAEFLVDAILRGDPFQQAEIDTKYLQAGVYLRSEVRDWKNMKRVEGLDQPHMPINMGGNPVATATIEPTEDTTDEPK